MIVKVKEILKDIPTLLSFRDNTWDLEDDQEIVVVEFKILLDKRSTRKIKPDDIISVRSVNDCIDNKHGEIDDCMLLAVNNQSTGV